MFYSKTTGGFYDREIHGDSIPVDAVEISNELHAELMAGQANGKIIGPDVNGYPLLKDRSAPTKAQRIAIAAADYDADKKVLHDAFIAAIAAGGPNEQATKESIRSALEDLKSQHAAAVAAIKAS